MQNTPSASTDVNDPSRLSLVDRLAAKLCTPEQIAREIMDQVYAGLEVHCRIPDAYKHCELKTERKDIDRMGDEELRELLKHPPGSIINPESPHLKAIELFTMIQEGHELVTQDHDPLRPTVGAYLYGPAGVGKTHIMAAYGRTVETMLSSRISNLMRAVRDLLRIALDRYEKEMETYSDTRGAQKIVLTTKGDMEIQRNPSQAFMAQVEEIKRRLRANRNQPTDMLYLGFKDLVDLFGQQETRAETLEAIANAPVVFVDDLENSSPDGVAVVQRLIEERYERGRFGTFVTTNYDVDKVAGPAGESRNHIQSRVSESLVHIDFSGCKDWRKEVKHRRIRFVEEEICRRVAEKHPDGKPAC
jgi:DNA replication protein DnaC